MRSERPRIIARRGEQAAADLSTRDEDTPFPERLTLVDHLLTGAAWDDMLAGAVMVRATAPSRTPTV